MQLFCLLTTDNLTLAAENVSYELETVHNGK